MRFVWWLAEIRRLKEALSRSEERVQQQLAVIMDVTAQRHVAERQRDSESKKVTLLQNEVSYLKEQAVGQRQERRAIYEQRDEARRLLLELSSGQGSPRVPDWVTRPCDENGAPVRPGEAGGAGAAGSGGGAAGSEWVDGS